MYILFLTINNARNMSHNYIITIFVSRDRYRRYTSYYSLQYYLTICIIVCCVQLLSLSFWESDAVVIWFAMCLIFRTNNNLSYNGATSLACIQPHSSHVFTELTGNRTRMLILLRSDVIPIINSMLSAEFWSCPVTDERVGLGTSR